MRTYFHKINYAWFIHWVKNNESQQTEVQNTHMKVSAFENPQLIKIVKKQFNELRRLKPNEMPARFKTSPYANVTDYRDPRYWSKTLTDYINSGYIGVRQAVAIDGIKSLRLIMPKSQQSTSQSCGRSLTLKMGQVKLFLDALEEYGAYIALQSQGEGDSD